MFKHSDAVHCLANFEAEDPFLIALAKCNNDQVFDECLAEWTKWVKKKEPHNLKYFSISLTKIVREPLDQLISLILRNQFILFAPKVKGLKQVVRVNNPDQRYKEGCNEEHNCLLFDYSVLMLVEILEGNCLNS